MIPLRTAILTDAPALARLVSFVHLWHAATYPEVFKTDPPVDDLERYFRKELQDPEVTIYLSGAPPCGYLMARHQNRADGPFTWPRKRLLIDHIAVDPDFRRQGHGRALIEAAIAEARAQDCDEVLLDSWGDNAGAHAFFRAVGFEPRRVLFHAPLDPELAP